MNDEKPFHSHRHLNHLVRMRMIHLDTVLTESELIGIGSAGRNMFLRKTADSIHSVGSEDPMPVNAGRFQEFVRDENPNPVALYRFDGRAWSLPIVAPAVNHHARGKLSF